jgi:hypothetical protein
MHLELLAGLILAASPPLASGLPGEGAPEPVWTVGEVCGKTPRIEGVALGDPLAAVDRILDLSRAIPDRAEGVVRYTWVAPVQREEPSPSEALRRLEVLFRDGRIASVEATYATRLTFVRMGAAHEGRCGEPTWVKAGPPQELEGKDGRPVFLWIQGWHWRRDHYTLTIWGEHYSAEKTRPTRGEQVFRFRLDSIP